MSTSDAQQVLAHHSKSFALASRLLPPEIRSDVAVLYAYCRRADDAIDEAPANAIQSAEALSHELESVYRGEPQRDPLLAAFQGVVQRHDIPAEYPRALLQGLRSDVGRVRVETREQLLLYAHRVAGVVGLMLCRIFGVRDAGALARADELGIAMQLTNICRDVAEDAGRDRLYLPAELLRECDVPTSMLADLQLRAEARPPLLLAVRRVLALADRYYASAEAGMAALPLRVALAVRAAGLIYAEIGSVISRRGEAALVERAVVPRSRKWWLVLRAAFTEVGTRVRSRLRSGSRWSQIARGARDAL